YPSTVHDRRSCPPSRRGGRRSEADRYCVQYGRLGCCGIQRGRVTTSGGRYSVEQGAERRAPCGSALRALRSVLIIWRIRLWLLNTLSTNSLWFLIPKSGQYCRLFSKSI